MDGNPNLKILFTVSPIRHVRDGMHANQLSKATLLLAIDALQKTFVENVFTFRLMSCCLTNCATIVSMPRIWCIRPKWLCVIFGNVSRGLVSPQEALQIMEESENIRKSLSHKPFYPSSDEYKRFLGQIVLKIDQLNGKYPYLDFQM